MLFVGDTNYLFKTNNQYNGKNQPNVHINNVHFVRNQAQGGSGNGGGGGYGAGGAITLTSGDLKITNTVFQDLVAKGGTGVRTTKGHEDDISKGQGGLGTGHLVTLYSNERLGYL